MAVIPKILQFKLVIVEWRAGEVRQGLLQQLGLDEDILELLQLGAGLVQFDPLLGGQHGTGTPNLEQEQEQEQEQERRSRTHSQLESEHLFQKFFLARYGLGGAQRLGAVSAPRKTRFQILVPKLLGLFLHLGEVWLRHQDLVLGSRSR